MNIVLDIIKEIECLLWAIAFLVAIYMIMKNYCLPKIRLSHERQMKIDANKQEKEWADFDNTKASTDDALKKKVDDLKQENSKLKEELKSEKYNRGLLEKQLKLYSDIFTELNVEVKPKENKK